MGRSWKNGKGIAQANLVRAEQVLGFVVLLCLWYIARRNKVFGYIKLKKKLHKTKSSFSAPGVIIKRAVKRNVRNVFIIKQHRNGKH